MSIKLLYKWSLQRPDGKDNFGDLLSEYIIRKITKKKVVLINKRFLKRYKYFFRTYLSVGSIIRLANKNSIVWGSGIMSKNEKIKNAKFLAVRGPMTRQRILELGCAVPEVYGDPAILLPKLYNKKAVKKFKLGIIPHF